MIKIDLVFIREIVVHFRIALLATFALVVADCPCARGQEVDPPKAGQQAASGPAQNNDRAADPSSSTKSPDKSSTSADKSRRVEAGRSVSRSYDFKEAKQEVTYQIYLPENYYDEIKKNADTTFPLIVALHGYGSNPMQIVGYPGFIRRAEKRGYVIVAPMGYNKKGWYGSHGPKGGYGDLPRNLGELSEQDVLNVLKMTRDEFNIDSQRIYLYGHSMGGGGSIHLAMKYPDQWAAVAPMAPAMPWGLKNLEKAKHIPFFVVHGDKDKVLAVRKTRKFVEQLKELKMTHVYREVKNGDHVSVAWKYFDEIFDFFDQHKKHSGKPNKQVN